METIFLSISWLTFMTLGIVFMFLYTPACRNLVAMLDSIKLDGKLTKTKADWSWFKSNYSSLDCWTISLPISDKYLQYGIVKKTVEDVRFYRKIMKYLAPICALFMILLLLITFNN